MFFQDLILNLHLFWGKQGCVILQPNSMKMSAGTFYEATFLCSGGSKQWMYTYAKPPRTHLDLLKTITEQYHMIADFTMLSAKR